jgi:16S rRNA (guanine527-N7)-methyltransferase
MSAQANLDEPLAALGDFAVERGIAWTPERQQQVSSYVSLVAEYNKKTNLTADPDPKDLILRHVADAFAAAPVLKSWSEERPGFRVADLGSGGGFIGIGLKIAWPEAEVTLIDTLQRRYDFMNLAAVKLGLKGMRVVKMTAGKQGSPRAKDFDAVVARALAPLPEALALMAPLAKPGGLLLVYQSEPVAASPIPEARLERCVPYRLPAEDKDRALALFRRS